MKKIASLLLIGLTVLNLNAQEKDPVLLSIGDKAVKLSEFNAIFNKNNANENATESSINEYLELYIKFKLKVSEAEDLGYDTLPKFINELQGYRKQLAQPYLTDKEVTEGLIKEAYERMKTDVKASHILVKIGPDAGDDDTLKAYNEAIKIRKRIVGGEDFGVVAKDASSDPSAKKNAGNLGYFSALHMVYAFETAAYGTEVGKVSMPIRTRFGYHIIKVIDKRRARGLIKVAHIMVKTTKDGAPKENELAKQKIDEIYAKLTVEKQAFSELASQFSDDQGSARKGGELPEFNSGKMVAEFEEASYALANDGDVSQPIKTAFGWHIIKRLGLKNLASYDELYSDIKSKVSRDSRSNKSMQSLLKKIKEENGFKENIKERNDFYKLVTVEDLKAGNFKSANTAKYNKLMFGFYAEDGDKAEFTQLDFAALLEKKNLAKQKELNVKSEVNKLYKKALEQTAIDFKDDRLIKTSREFRLLMQEYRDGILLFDLTDEKVWSKAVKDSAGLYEFHDQNKEKYMWGQRAEATLYICENATVAKNLEKLLKKKAKKGYTNADLLKMINVDSQLSLKIEEGKYAKGDQEDVDAVAWTKGTSATLVKEKNVVIVQLNSILEAAPKQLDEIKGLITSDYQNHLEKEWVAALNAKYKVTVNKEVLKLVK